MAGTLAGLCLVTAALEVARGQGGAPQEAPRPAEPADVSERELQAFAESYVEVWRIRNTYEHMLAQVEDPEKAKALQRQANTDINEALEQSGLTSERYHAIYLAVLNDAALREQANDAIQSVQEE